MPGPVQKKWLKNKLKASPATLKIIASSVPFAPGIKPGSLDPWDGYPEVQEEIFSLQKKKKKGVLLLAADRHRIDLRKIKRPKGYDFYELVSGRLTSKHVHPVIKTDGLLWGYNQTCGFCLLQVDTKKKEPVIVLENYDFYGALLMKEKVLDRDLQFK